MGDRTVSVLLMLLMISSCAVVGATAGYYRMMGEEEYGGVGGGRGGRGGMFILEKSKQMVKTEAGEVRVVKGFAWRGGLSPMHIGFVSMEPNTLFLPQYMDASLILFVHRGEAKVAWIYKDGLVERQLKMGDIYRIPAGSTFYMVNTGKGQRLQLICSIDTSEGLGLGMFQSFFIAGGSNPTSVLSGFDTRTITAALNVTKEEFSSIMRQKEGAIVYIGEHAADIRGRLTPVDGRDGEPDEEEAEEALTWTWRKLLKSIVGGGDGGRKDGKKGSDPVRSPDSYNLYDRKPDFKNNYGSSLALDEDDYSPLKHSGIGVYLVSLKAGSMMAPHVNPTATEYGVVLSGAGSVQVVFPNGSSAMNAEVREGDVFWIPRYFPFCQIASRGGPMVFFGFTTSARLNRPQFLVGASSVLRTMMGPELAAAFGAGEGRFQQFVSAQNESVILPAWPRPGGGGEGEESEWRKREREQVVFETVRRPRVAAA